MAQSLAAACLLISCSAGAPVSAVSPNPAGESWTMYRGDLVRDGRPPGATLDEQAASRLQSAWRAHVGGAVDGTPAVTGGLVIAGSAGGTLVALDSRSGRTVWSRRGLGAISGSASAEGARVFVGTLTGFVHAFRTSDGSPAWVWRGPPNAAIWASPVVHGGLVIVGVASPYGDKPLVPGRLYGLDEATGQERWSSCIRAACAPGGGVWSTPAIDAQGNAFVGVGNPDDGVLAFDPATGKQRWLVSLYPDDDRDLDVGASPVIFQLAGHEVVVQAAVEGLLAVVDASNGSIVWSRELVKGTAVHGLLASPAYDGRAVYVASASPPTGLVALSAADGSELWRHDTQLPVYSAPAVGNGLVIFGTGAVFGDVRSGSLIALSTRDGRALWSVDLPSAVRSGPAIAGDLVVAGDAGGDVIAFRPSG